MDARIGRRHPASCAGLLVARVGLLVGAVGLAGCMSFGSVTLDRDRLDFTAAVANSWKHQMLLNIVKLRYADTPFFVDVGQIVSGYQLQGTVSVAGTVVPNAPAQLFQSRRWGNLHGSAHHHLRAADRVSVHPDHDDSHSPDPVDGVDGGRLPGGPLAPRHGAEHQWRREQQGWGGRGRAADPDFVQIVKALWRIQESGAVGFRVEVDKETKREGVIMAFPRRGIPPDIQAERDVLRKLLGLNPEQSDFRSPTAREQIATM